MYCTHCGARAPQDANFCPSCGTELARPEHSTGTSTLAIELDGEERHHLDDLPPLPEGTGMLVVVRGPSTGARFLLDPSKPVRTRIGRRVR